MFIPGNKTDFLAPHELFHRWSNTNTVAECKDSELIRGPIFTDISGSIHFILGNKIDFLAPHGLLHRVAIVVDVTTLKMARKPVKLQKENPAGCAGEGKQSKGN